MSAQFEQSLQLAKCAVENYTRGGSHQPCIHDAVNAIHALKGSMPRHEIFAHLGALLLPFLANTNDVEMCDNRMGGKRIVHGYWPCFAAMTVMKWTLMNYEASESHYIDLITNIPAGHFASILASVDPWKLSNGDDFFRCFVINSLSMSHLVHAPNIAAWVYDTTYFYGRGSERCMHMLDAASGDAVACKTLAAALVPVAVRYISSNADSTLKTHPRFKPRHVYSLFCALKMGMPVLEAVFQAIGVDTLLEANASDALAKAIGAIEQSTKRTRDVSAQTERVEALIRNIYKPTVSNGKVFPPASLRLQFERDSFSGI